MNAQRPSHPIAPHLTAEPHPCLHENGGIPTGPADIPLSRRAMRHVLTARSREYPRRFWPQTAVVFAPHPDDEVLGCGGTVILKRLAGAPVHIVYMTDGRRSHTEYMDPDTLKAKRKQEALNASARLGVDGARVTFLDFEDGGLQRAASSARGLVERILLSLDPSEVFLPYRFDTPADHAATREIVLTAVHRLRRPLTVMEYPVWFWHSWPWIPRVPETASRISTMRRGIASALRAARDLRLRVRIGDVLENKWAALREHETQVRRFADQWPTLGEVGAGEFLPSFFQEHEFFCGYRLFGV